MNHDTPGTIVTRLRKVAVFDALDVALARLVSRLDGVEGSWPGFLAATANLAVRQGHSCLPLDAVAEVLEREQPGCIKPGDLPSVEVFRGACHDSAHCGEGDILAGTPRPLYLDDAGRLYLGRLARCEATVAAVFERLLERGAAMQPDAALLKEAMQATEPGDGDAIDWQRVAVLTGLVSPLTVITGGPGTGKTTTVAKLLLALVRQAAVSGAAAPKIAMTAPTGKAAARLGEALHAMADHDRIGTGLSDALPREAVTLHRLLGVRPGSVRARHDCHHRLDVDVVVVDEVSMISLELMAMLLAVLPDHARLVLVGDSGQLASVGAGHVLAGIAEVATETVSPSHARLLHEVLGYRLDEGNVPALSDALVRLKASHRFDAAGGIGALADKVRRGQADDVAALLRSGSETDVLWCEPADVTAWVLEHCLARFAGLADAPDAASALAASDRFRVLTALRQGPAGCVALNAAIERRLGAGTERGRVQGYRGRLLMVTENDADSGLANGDVGIVWPDDNGQLMAWFHLAGGLQGLPLSVLPAYEPAFAVTIHKSQGSEFDDVVIVLPPAGSRMLGRESLYTAITRARREVTVVAGMDAVRSAIGQPQRRYSGLPDRLRRLDGQA